MSSSSFPGAVPPRTSRFHHGYAVDDVDALVQRLQSQLSGSPTGEPITADELQHITFEAERGGYDQRAVDVVIDELVTLLRSTQPPQDAGPPMAAASAGAVSLAAHIPPEWQNPTFTTSGLQSGYAMKQVDDLIDQLVAAFTATDHRDRPAVGAVLQMLRSTSLGSQRGGYAMPEVDDWWTKIEILLTAESR